MYFLLKTEKKTQPFDLSISPEYYVSDTLLVNDRHAKMSNMASKLLTITIKRHYIIRTLISILMPS